MYYVALTRARHTLVCNPELDALLTRVEQGQFPERAVPVAGEPEPGEALPISQAEQSSAESLPASGV